MYHFLMEFNWRFISTLQNHFHDKKSEMTLQINSTLNINELVKKLKEIKSENPFEMIDILSAKIIVNNT